MRFLKLSLLALSSVVALSTIACSSSTSEEEDADEGALSDTNLGGRNFGLKDGELVLTLDDGPGARTKELVDFLVAEKIPATFFMVGKNADTNRATMEYVARRSAEVPGGLIVANHSQTHTDPLPKQGVSGSINEIMGADRILHESIITSQAQFAAPISFFRPPYGAFTALGAANIARVNAQGGSAYVGPVFWEIGGELKNGFSADWACWGRGGVDIDTCREGYVREAVARKKGIILCHDVHSKTIDMLIGKGTRSLIKQLQETSWDATDPRNTSKHFKFVSMRKDEAAVSDFAQRTEQARATGAKINASANVNRDTGLVLVTYDAAPVGAAKAVVTFDRAPTTAELASAGRAGGNIEKRDLGPGQHFVVVTAIDANGKAITENRFNFIVPVLIDRAPDDGEGDACSNYHKLKERRSDGRTAGRPFKLFHGEIPCKSDTPAANVALRDGNNNPVECYRYNGTARVAAISDGNTAAVHAIGGDEWTVEYDLGYAGHPDDVSKLTLTLESVTGKIVTGKRVKLNGNEMASFHDNTVDCENGYWRGEFNYRNGVAEKFLFRSPVEGEPEYNDR